MDDGSRPADGIDRWHAAQTLFEELLPLSSDERRRRLDQRSTADPDLAAEVESLLTFHARSDHELSGVIAEAAVDYHERADEGDPLPRVSGYAVDGLIGRGGMSRVYRAHRVGADFDQAVAIKVVTDPFSRDFLDRFKSERQILAALRHPGIATILDGGATDDGTPYLVMELIDGMPIDEWADRRELDGSTRLDLFLRVCEAVEFAHQNLVVHSDLKPANILITEQGHPKLVDFGIARSLQPIERGAESDTGEPGPLSLAWASPEQVRGDRVTTASDLYSLGLVLYRLICGRGPFDFDPGTDARKTICETPVPLPSERVGDRRLRGDLDAIIVKALRKDAQDRYGSVRELTRDLRAYLEGRPVSARPQTRAYLLSRFARRHSRALIAAVAILITLTISLVFTSYQWFETERAKDLADVARGKAERRFEELHSLVHVMLFDFYDLIEQRPGVTRARRLLATYALDYLDTLLAEAGDDPDLCYELAVAYVKVGDVQGNPVQANLGDSQGALESYGKADSIPARPEVEDLAAVREFDLALLHDKIGEVLAHVGETEAARAHHVRAYELRRARLERDGPSEALDRDLSRSHHRLGNVRLLSGDARGARDEFDRALALLEPIRSESDEAVRRAVAVAHLSRGDARAELGDTEHALEDYSIAVDLLGALAETDRSNVRWSRDYGIALNRVVRIRMNQGDHARALEECLTATDIAVRIREADPSDADAQRELSLCFLNQGYLRSRLGDTDAALALYLQAQELIQERRREDPGNHRIVRDDWLVAFRRACLLDEDGQLDDATNEFERACALGDELRARDPENAPYGRFCALGYWYAGRHARRRGEPARADQLYGRAESILRDTLEFGSTPRARRDLQSLLGEWAVALEENGQRSDAEAVRSRLGSEPTSDESPDPE
ncbi:MAG: serine/threonine protein kinase [Planctomycetes bacterium]|nr:serine/threonine protein kinase [Planctomycetota bacterium]